MVEISVDFESVVKCLRFILVHFGPPGFAILTFGFILWHFDKVSRGVTCLLNIPAVVFNLGKSEALRRSIQNDINTTVLQLEQEVPGLFDKAVKVRWIEEGLDYANVKPGSIFVRVRTGSDQDNVFINVVRHFLDRALLHEARRYIHGHIIRATQLVLIERFLQHSRFRSAQALFRAEHYDPALAQDKSIVSPVKTLELLDHQGLFTRVFLRECLALPEQLGHRHETSGPKYDLLGFLNYLDELLRGLERDRPIRDFEFSNNTFQVAFAILADIERVRSQGPGFYRSRTRRSIMNGARTVYIAALGEYNARLAAELAGWLQSKGLIRAYRFSKYSVSMWGHSLLAVCGVCFAASNIERVREEEDAGKPVVDDENLQQILETIVPEISTGDVQVVKTALLKADQALVIVHTSDPDINAVGACVGHGAKRVRAIRTAAEMDVRFVSWFPNEEERIAACLDVAKDDRITGIEIEPALRFATVHTSSDHLLRQLSEHESTKQLTEAITGFDIHFQLDQTAVIRSIIEETVPEVRDGSITIEKIIGLPGIITRVLVSSRYVYRPTLLCGQHVREIAAKAKTFNTGRICFSEKHDDPRETIISALYPVDREDIIEVDLVDERTARVVVNSKYVQAKAVGKEGAYVKSASKLTDYWIEVDVEEAV